MGGMTCWAVPVGALILDDIAGVVVEVAGERVDEALADGPAGGVGGGAFAAGPGLWGRHARVDLDGVVVGDGCHCG